MTYIFLVLILAVIILGMVSVASSPSPYFAALGLVVLAGAACILLWFSGGSFHSLVLLLIYLGGMLVVFAYSAALAADPFPRAWGELSVLGVAICYSALVLGAVIWLTGLQVEPAYLLAGGGNLEGNTDIVWVDTGTGVIYSLSGGFLGLCAWVLFLTLFVVISVSWGQAWGAIKKIS